MQEDKTDQPDIPEEWLRRAQESKTRLKKMSPDERKKWGIEESSLENQKQTDEKRHPSS